MKYFFSAILLLSSLFILGQPKNGSESAMNSIRKIFNSYKQLSENIDSKDNKEVFTKSIKSLKTVNNQKDLLLLVDVWMYYDPTDFPTRELVEPIFFDNKSATLTAIKNRIKNKQKWERKDKAPYAELYSLKAALAK